MKQNRNRKDRLMALFFLAVIALGVGLTISQRAKEEGTNAEDGGSMQEEEVSKEAGQDIEEATPTNPPDSVMPAVMLNGELITLNAGATMIPPEYQEKMEQAEYIGEIKGNVPSNEYPKEEMTANAWYPAGAKLYHYVSETEDVYILCSEDGYYCTYGEAWYVLEIK